VFVGEGAGEGAGAGEPDGPGDPLGDADGDGEGDGGTGHFAFGSLASAFSVTSMVTPFGSTLFGS